MAAQILHRQPLEAENVLILICDRQALGMYGYLHQLDQSLSKWSEKLS